MPILPRKKEAAKKCICIADQPGGGNCNEVTHIEVPGARASSRSRRSHLNRNIPGFVGRYLATDETRVVVGAFFFFLVFQRDRQGFKKKKKNRKTGVHWSTCRSDVAATDDWNLLAGNEEQGQNPETNKVTYMHMEICVEYSS